MPVVQSKGKGRNRQPNQEVRVDEQIMEPGDYEVGPEDTFTIVCHVKKHKDRWVISVPDDEQAKRHEIVFRMWNYEQRVEMRKKSTTYDRIRRMHLIDNDALNRLKVQRFLKSWTFENDNPRMKLHHVQGVLTDEGWKIFSRLLHPSIAIFIVDEMNRVYESNG